MQGTRRDRRQPEAFSPAFGFICIILTQVNPIGMYELMAFNTDGAIS